MNIFLPIFYSSCISCTLHNVQHIEDTQAMFVHSMELNALIKWLFGFHFYLLLFGWMKYTRVVLFQAQEIWPTSPWKDMCHLPMSWKSLENGLCWDSFSLWEFSPLPWLYWIYTHRSNISLKHYIPESVFQKNLGYG